MLEMAGYDNNEGWNNLERGRTNLRTTTESKTDFRCDT